MRRYRLGGGNTCIGRRVRESSSSGGREEDKGKARSPEEQGEGGIAKRTFKKRLSHLRRRSAESQQK